MATRTKTTHWGLGPCDSATVASGDTRTFGVQTIYVPEITDRVFRAAIVELSFSGTETSAADITAVVAGLTVNVTRTTDAITGTLTNSGENQGGVLQFDFTAGIAANFGAGASQTLTLDVVVTGVATNNVSASLMLTYDFADTATTQCKTYMIPLQVTNVALNTSSGSYGDIVPYLTGESGELVENSVVIRDYYFVIEGNENGNGGTTDFALNVRLDSDGYTTFGTIERALGSDKLFRYIWSKKGAVPDTTALHSFSAYCGTSSHNHMSLVLVVTYEFNVAATTMTVNSLQIPFRIGPHGSTTLADAQYLRLAVDIQEPTTITLRESGVKFYWTPVGAATGANLPKTVFASASERGYQSNVASGSCTGSLVASQTATPSTLARGMNYIDLALYCGSTRGTYNYSGIYYLNYRSGIATTGIASHNRTVYSHLLTTNFTSEAPSKEIAAQAIIAIADTNYWLQGVGAWVWQYHASTSTMYEHRLYMEILSGEGFAALGDGWQQFFTSTPAPMLESGSHASIDFETSLFKRYPDDVRVGAFNVEASRKFRVMSPRWTGSIFFMAVYQSITFTKTGDVTGYAGTGAVTVKIHDTTTGEHLYTVTAASGGAYSVTMYDSARDHYAEVYEDATHVGRSANWKAA